MTLEAFKAKHPLVTKVIHSSDDSEVDPSHRFRVWVTVKIKSPEMKSGTQAIQDGPTLEAALDRMDERLTSFYNMQKLGTGKQRAK